MKRKIFLILNLFFILNDVNSEEENIMYKCGEDQTIPKAAENYIPMENNNSTYRRRLDGFKEFNIYLDLENIEYEINLYNLTHYHDILINSMIKAKQTLESLLRVRPPFQNYDFDDDQITDLNINKWNKTIIGTEAKNNSLGMINFGIDLIIFGRFDNLGESTLASAGARYFDPENGRPLIGIVNINYLVDYSKANSQEYFQSIIIHEFTHILGFSNYFFNNYFHNVFSKTDDYGINRYYINSTKVIEVGKKYYNCSDIEGIELEDYGGSGTAGSHWEARILLGEYMNGIIYTEEQVISEFTLALLEDSGYYKPNYYTGGLMRYGKNKGCSFIQDRCVNQSQEINPYFENEFYDSINSEYLIDPSCSSGRQSRTYNAWWLRNDIPEFYKYFGNNNYSGWPSADYCPVPQNYYTEGQKGYFIGHCSSKGSGEYGTKITYNISNEYYTYNKSEELYNITGETYSDHSYCFLSSLTDNNTENINYYSNTVRAVCFEVFCSTRSLTIKIHDDYIVCPRSGGKIKVQGYEGYILCPDYNLLCSGTVLCNDMFDCVDKKSEIKEESYYYDYEIKTSQNIERANSEEADEINNYELTENGTCPLFCSHCKENQNCVKCRKGYRLEVIDNNREIFNCIPDNELSTSILSSSQIKFETSVIKKSNIPLEKVSTIIKSNLNPSLFELNTSKIKTSNLINISNSSVLNKYNINSSILINNSLINSQYPINISTLINTNKIKSTTISTLVSSYPINFSTFINTIKMNSTTISSQFSQYPINFSTLINTNKIISTTIPTLISSYPINFSTLINTNKINSTIISTLISFYPINISTLINTIKINSTTISTLISTYSINYTTLINTIKVNSTIISTLISSYPINFSTLINANKINSTTISTLVSSYPINFSTLINTNKINSTIISTLISSYPINFSTLINTNKINSTIISTLISSYPINFSTLINTNKINSTTISTLISSYPINYSTLINTNKINTTTISTLISSYPINYSTLINTIKINSTIISTLISHYPMYNSTLINTIKMNSTTISNPISQYPTNNSTLINTIKMNSTTISNPISQYPKNISTLINTIRINSTTIPNGISQYPKNISTIINTIRINSTTIPNVISQYLSNIPTLINITKINSNTILNDNSEKPITISTLINVTKINSIVNSNNPLINKETTPLTNSIIVDNTDNIDSTSSYIEETDVETHITRPTNIPKPVSNETKIISIRLLQIKIGNSSVNLIVLSETIPQYTDLIVKIQVYILNSQRNLGDTPNLEDNFKATLTSSISNSVKNFVVKVDSYSELNSLFTNNNVDNLRIVVKSIDLKNDNIKNFNKIYSKEIQLGDYADSQNQPNIDLSAFIDDGGDINYISKSFIITGVTSCTNDFKFNLTLDKDVDISETKINLVFTGNIESLQRNRPGGIIWGGRPSGGNRPGGQSGPGGHNFQNFSFQNFSFGGRSPLSLNPECVLSSKLKRVISCHLEQENLNLTYTMEDYIKYEENYILFISMEKNLTLNIYCHEEPPIKAIIVIAGIYVFVVSIVIISVVFINKKSRGKDGYEPPQNSNNNMIGLSSGDLSR